MCIYLCIFTIFETYLFFYDFLNEGIVLVVNSIPSSSFFLYEELRPERFKKKKEAGKWYSVNIGHLELLFVHLLLCIDLNMGYVTFEMYKNQNR